MDDEEESGGGGMHLSVEGEQMRSPSQSFRVAHGDPIDWFKLGGGEGISIHSFTMTDPGAWRC